MYKWLPCLFFSYYFFFVFHLNVCRCCQRKYEGNRLKYIVIIMAVKLKICFNVRYILKIKFLCLINTKMYMYIHRRVFFPKFLFRWNGVKKNMIVFHINSNTMLDEYKRSTYIIRGLIYRKSIVSGCEVVLLLLHMHFQVNCSYMLYLDLDLDLILQVFTRFFSLCFFFWILNAFHFINMF